MAGCLENPSTRCMHLPICAGIKSFSRFCPIGLKQDDGCLRVSHGNGVLVNFSSFKARIILSQELKITGGCGWRSGLASNGYGDFPEHIPLFVVLLVLYIKDKATTSHFLGDGQVFCVLRAIVSKYCHPSKQGKHIGASYLLSRTRGGKGEGLVEDFFVSREGLRASKQSAVTSTGVCVILNPLVDNLFSCSHMYVIYLYV